MNIKFRMSLESDNEKGFSQVQYFTGKKVSSKKEILPRDGGARTKFIFIKSKL